jgi:hypothetical protein
MLHLKNIHIYIYDHPSIPKILSDNSPYNYYDYIDAWSKFFLYQTPNCDIYIYIYIYIYILADVLPIDIRSHLENQNSSKMRKLFLSKSAITFAELLN